MCSGDNRSLYSTLFFLKVNGINPLNLHASELVCGRTLLETHHGCQDIAQPQGPCNNTRAMQYHMILHNMGIGSTEHVRVHKPEDKTSSNSKYHCDSDRDKIPSHYFVLTKQAGKKQYPHTILSLLDKQGRNSIPTLFYPLTSREEIVSPQTILSPLNKQVRNGAPTLFCPH